MARVQFTDDAREDIRDLDGSSRKLVLKALKELETEPDKRGLPLGNNPRGNLTTLRKLVVGDREFRAVFRVIPDRDIVDVIVVARRADDEVYELAIARLRMHEDAEVREFAEGLQKLMEP